MVSEREDCITGVTTLMRITGCTGLQVGRTELFCTVLDCAGLCWAVLGCNGLYWAVMDCPVRVVRGVQVSSVVQVVHWSRWSR